MELPAGGREWYDVALVIRCLLADQFSQIEGRGAISRQFADLAEYHYQTSKDRTVERRPLAIAGRETQISYFSGQTKR